MVVVIMAYVSFPFSSLLFFPFKARRKGPGSFCIGVYLCFSEWELQRLFGKNAFAPKFQVP